MSHNRFTLYPYQKLVMLALTLLLAFSFSGCVSAPIPPIPPGETIALFPGSTAQGLKAAVLDNAAFTFTLVRTSAISQWIVAFPVPGGYGFSALDVKTGFSLTPQQLCGQAICAETLKDILKIAQADGWQPAQPSPGLVALVNAFINTMKTPALVIFPVSDDGSVDFWGWMDEFVPLPPQSIE